MGRLVGRAAGQRLVHIEARDARDAVEGSIKALRGLGDWTENPRELRAFPYTETGKHRGARDFTRRGLGDWTENPRELRAFPYTETGKHRGARDFTRAVIDRARRHPRPHRPPTRGRRRR